MKNISITGIFHHPYCSISPGIARASGSIAYGKQSYTLQSGNSVRLFTKKKKTRQLRNTSK